MIFDARRTKGNTSDLRRAEFGFRRGGVHGAHTPDVGEPFSGVFTFAASKARDTPLVDELLNAGTGSPVSSVMASPGGLIVVSLPRLFSPPRGHTCPPGGRRAMITTRVRE